MNDNDRADGFIPYEVRHQMAQRLDRCIADLSIIADPDLARIFERIYREMQRMTLECVTLEARRERLRPFEIGIGQILAAAQKKLDGVDVAPDAPPTVLDVLHTLERDGRDVLGRIRQHHRRVTLVKP